MAEREKDGFEMLNDFGCVQEQVKAALKILSDNLHEFFELIHGEMPANQQNRLYNQWLLLELVRRDFDRNDELFHTAESALFKARLNQQRQGGSHA